MITEEKKKALEELCRMIRQFAIEHDIDVFAATSVTEEGEEKINRAIGTVLIGKTGDLTSSIMGCIRPNPTTRDILTTAVNNADGAVYDKFNVTKG